MESYFVLMDWKNEYYQNIHIHSQIQCNPYHNTSDLFHMNRTKNSEIDMEPQKTPNSESNPEKKEQS